MSQTVTGSLVQQQVLASIIRVPRVFALMTNPSTLNTNFSPLRTAMVSKCPSQMSGPWSGLGSLVGRGGGGGGGGPDLVPELGKML